MPLFFGGSYWLIIILALVLGMGTQAYVTSTYRRYSRVALSDGRSGAQVARDMLDAGGLEDVPVEMIGGQLSDHYDPRSRVLRLSADVYQGRSVAAAGVASHEAGHAVQHAQGFVFASLRQTLVPVASIGSQAAFPLIFLGVFLRVSGLVTLGVILFAAAVAFSVVTLPVEFDASRRAVASLAGGPAGTSAQVSGARAVLTAAALTYVAATLVSVLQLLYFIGLSRRD